MQAAGSCRWCRPAGLAVVAAGAGRGLRARLQAGAGPSRCSLLPARPPDAPPAAGAIGSNLRKLHAAKRAFNRHKPQAVLYVDRLDAGRRDLADLNVSTRRDACLRWVFGAVPGLSDGPLHGRCPRSGETRPRHRTACPSRPPCSQVLRSISEVFGQDMWFSTVRALGGGGGWAAGRRVPGSRV